ncbi:MAG: FHA domain-containing protein, partial [Actinomycetota bacterium]|nr:FHA domain-containing protein [Actinomycetota bacterium]
MRIKLTLRRPGAPLTDIVVMADSTATVADVAGQIAGTDPLRSVAASGGDVLSLSVAPPTSDELVTLNPDLLIGDAPVGSGFLAEVVNLGPNRAATTMLSSRAAALLTVVSGPAAGQEFPLPVGHFFIGRDTANDVVLSDPLVSKRHARIEVAATFVEIVDLNSANGILVDGGLVQRLRVIPGQK